MNRHKVELEPVNHSGHYASTLEALHSADLGRVLDVRRMLEERERRDRLSAGERRLLRQARILLGEQLPGA